MKQLLLIVAVSISLVSCTSDADNSKRSSGNKESENLAIAKRYMQAVETKDVATMDSLLANDYHGYGPSIGDSTNKQEALATWKYNAENLYESIQYTRHKELAVTVSEGEAQGDWVLNWAYLTIKYKDGRGPVNIWVSAVYRIENGKIIHSRSFYNEADVLEQLGFSVVAPEKEAQQ